VLVVSGQMVGGWLAMGCRNTDVLLVDIFNLDYNVHKLNEYKHILSLDNAMSLINK
jgi:hypothetical protein